MEVRSRRFSIALITDLPIWYSYKTNQYGLAIDTIVGYNLVLPNGTVTYVTQSTHPNLFLGLKGGFNNFVSHFSNVIAISFSPPAFQGIVTDYTMTALPQTEVWVRLTHFVTVYPRSVESYASVD